MSGREFACSRVLTEKQKCYFWAYHAPREKLVAYELSVTRSGKVVDKRLAQFKGLIQTDEYFGYNGLKDREDITGFSCSTHARRRFDQAFKLSKNKLGYAAIALEKLKYLYGVEAKARELCLVDRERKRLRKKKSLPLLLEYRRWLKAIRKEVPPKSKLGDAINYTLNHWKELTRYIQHGQVEIDTNLVENLIRPLTLGKKNWMTMGDPSSGEISAIFYTLVQNCILQKINPRLYLHYLLTRVHEVRRKEVDPKSLLPHKIDRQVLEDFEAKELSTMKSVFSCISVITKGNCRSNYQASLSCQITS